MQAPFKQHPGFYNRPIHLDEEQQAAPMQVVERFFSSYDLSGLRQNLYDLVHTALTSENPIFEEPEPRDYISYFAHELEVLLEAVYLINSPPSLRGGHDEAI